MLYWSIHVDKEYVRGKRGISWAKFFRRVDVKDDALERLDGIDRRIADQMACLRKRKEPVVDPGPHCSSPHDCDYWDNCISDKPADWVALLPRMSGRRPVSKSKSATIGKLAVCRSDL